ADGVGTVSMTYLDQGHIGTLTDAAGAVWKYYYDSDGKRRIKVKTAGGAATEPDSQGGVRHGEHAAAWRSGRVVSVW
ncbi:MAG TPA: hypothetical protein PKN61_13865, partial [Acidobacteriota bacterium]|nr:hypothetical protein [Acidobacteriota bacterium]